MEIQVTYFNRSNQNPRATLFMLPMGSIKRVALGLLSLTFFLTFASVASSAVLHKQPSNLGLIGYWPMNEATSTRAGDFSGRGNTGTLTNGPTWTTGKLDKAISFDGSNDYVDTGTGINIANQSFTVSAWAKRSSTGTWDLIFFQGSGSVNNGLHVGFRSSNTFTCAFWGNDLDTIAYADTAWHHWACTFDSSSKVRRIYRDGIAVTSDTATANYQGTGNLLIGFSTSVSGSYFNGTIDEPRIYNRLLSVSEIFALYKSGSAKLNTSQNSKVKNGLVGLWSFDGGDMSGTTAFDRSGSANNGTLTNGPIRTIGKVGQALSFDGVNDFVAIPNQSIQNAYPITISAWIKATTSSGAVVNKYVSSSLNGYQLYFYNGILCGWYFRNNSNYVWDGADCGAGFSGLNDGKWHHVVFVVDSSGGVIYADGVKGVTRAWTGTPGAPTQTQDLWIGRYNAGYFPGLIDDTRIYNRALTQAEITKLYNTGGSKINAPQNSIPGSTLQSGLVGLWSFNGPDMSGTTALDRSGNANNGTLTNGPLRTIGKVGQGLSFDGVNDYVPMATQISPADTDRTACAWINTNSTARQGVISRRVTTSGWALTINRTTAGNITYINDATVIEVAGGITTGNWFYVCVSYVASTKAVALYVNGVSVGSGTISSADTGTVSARIGHDGLGYFSGRIDEPRVYNRALSASEIKQLYNLGR